GAVILAAEDPPGGQEEAVRGDERNRCGDGEESAAARARLEPSATDRRRIGTRVAYSHGSILWEWSVPSSDELRRNGVLMCAFLACPCQKAVTVCAERIWERALEVRLLSVHKQPQAARTS